MATQDSPYLVPRTVSEARSKKAEGGREQDMPEGAVILATTLDLMSEQHAVGEAGNVRIHPDGQHVTRFGMVDFLMSRGFLHALKVGPTGYAGEYRRDDDVIHFYPTSGNCDVVADVAGRRTYVECKGGVINSKHAGVQSRARSSLCELVGQLMALKADGSRHLAVRPFTEQSLVQARRMLPRCRAVGIEIGLAMPDGRIFLVEE